MDRLDGGNRQTAAPNAAKKALTGEAPPLRTARVATDPVKTTLRGGCAILAMDNPPVNGISNVVRRGLHASLAAAISDESIVAVIITGAGKQFSAGADIRQFNTPESTEWPMTRDLHALIAGSHKPVVAAIHGFAFGGGLELALGCHFRVGTASARLGLPEVTLGLIPGGGGTQRLPRLIGLPAALDMILSGKPVNGAMAHACGLIDALVERDIVDSAVEFALAKLPAASRLPLASELPLYASGFDFEACRASVPVDAGTTRAQQAAINAVEAATRLDFDHALAQERAIFDELVYSPESMALRQHFFEARAAVKAGSRAL
jgi:3-hydroxyacyl-CoA dehydrogenase